MNKSWAVLLKFSLVGLLNSGVDVLVFTVLVMAGVPVVPAQSISYGAGTCNSYLLNRRWTFHRKEKHSLKEPIKFMAVNLITLLMVTLLLDMLYQKMELSLPVSKITATAAGILINFAGSRYWVFRPTLDKRVNPNGNKKAGIPTAWLGTYFLSGTKPRAKE